MRRIKISLCALVSLCLSPPLLAESDWMLSGFGSIGAVTTNSDQAGFRRDTIDGKHTREGEINLSSLSLLGLQTNYRFNANLEFVAQALLRERPVQNSDTILRIASLNFEPLPNWQIRAGRFSQRTFLLTDSRPVGFSHLWTMPVQEFYSQLVSNYVDGIDSTYSFRTGQGFLSVYGSFGETNVYVDEPSISTTKIKLKRVGELNVEYERDQWLTRVSWSSAIQNNNLRSSQSIIDGIDAVSQMLMWENGLSVANGLDANNKKIEFFSAAFTFDNGSIKLISEIGRLQSETKYVPRINSAYLSLGKRYGRFTPFFLVSNIESNNGQQPELIAPFPSEEIEQLIAGTYSYIEAGFQQNSVGIGLRFDVNASATIKTQWEHKRVDRNGYSLWAPAENLQFPDENESMDVVSLRLDFIF